MMLSTQAARMGSVHTTLRKIGCSAPSKRTFLLVERGRSWLPTSPSSSHLFSGRPRDQYVAAVGMPIWNHRNKSTAASAKRHDFGDEKDDTTTTELSYHPYISSAGRHAAAAISITPSTTTTEIPAVNEAAAAWMINLGRNNDNEWLTGPRGREWFTGVHPRECPGM
jgi:hypothetical protein